MFILHHVFVVVRRHIAAVSWPALIALLIIHGGSTHLLLYLANETAVVGFDNFFYYYVVTTSTVGYGDLSPTTLAGKLVVAVYQIPMGLALFAAFLGKTSQTISCLLRRHMTGEKNFQHLKNHIIIFSWHPKRTAKIIDHILGDLRRQNRTILLCVKHPMEHPFATNEQVEFAKIISFVDKDDLDRVAVRHADRIIVDGDSDDERFTTALRIAKLVKPNCHISTHFDDETKVQMLRDHTSNVECNLSGVAEMLVRSIQDPGASRVQQELLSTLHGHTQFSLMVPDTIDPNGLAFMSLFMHFKYQYNATIVGIANNRFGDDMKINPDKNYRVTPGQVIHYIAEQRLLSGDVNWLVDN